MDSSFGWSVLDVASGASTVLQEAPFLIVHTVGGTFWAWRLCAWHRASRRPSPSRERRPDRLHLTLHLLDGGSCVVVARKSGINDEGLVVYAASTEVSLNAVAGFDVDVLPAKSTLLLQGAADREPTP